MNSDAKAKSHQPTRDSNESTHSGSNKQRDQGRVCERFLTAHSSARYLCQQVGVADLANHLIPVFSDLQEAHGRLVAREANRVLIQIVKAIRAKLVTSEQAQALFLLDGAALDALLNYLEAEPKNDLASHLSNLSRSAGPKCKKKNI